jgi:hypothetical protein
MPSPDQLCQKSAISGTAVILENPTFAQGFSAYSLTQKPGHYERVAEGEELGSNLLHVGQRAGG